MIKPLTIITVLSLLIGCSTPSQKLLIASAGADSATTYYGGRKGAEESNPVLGKGTNQAAVASFVYKLAVPKLAKTFGSKRTCMSFYRSMVASGAIGATNNLLIVNNQASTSSLKAGVVAGIGTYALTRNYADQYCTKL